MIRKSSSIGFLLALLTAGPGHADLIYFARGGEAQLPARIEGGTVRLETPGGPESFPLGDFREITPGHCPEREWEGIRSRAIRDGRVEARFEASWWALENGLTPEAIALLRESRPQAAGHAPTRRALRAIDALSAPCPDPDLEPLRWPLRGSKLATLRGDHVLLLHQATESEARERLEVLERVVQTFHILLAAQGIELSPPNRRLVSVCFAQRRDYLAFLRESEAGAFSETQGYYHPTLRAVFAFDTRTGDAQATARRAIENLRRGGESSREVDRRALLLDLEWRATDLGIAAHETVHQLTDGGLAPRFDDFPLWLHEGLAAQFEVVRGGRWAGVGRVHDARLPDYRSIHPSPRLAPLLRDSGFGHGYRRDVYAESWATVYFLRKTRPREFVAFLDLLRSPSSPESDRPGERAGVAFRATFGEDLARLEAGRRDLMAGLRTPLESGRGPIEPSRENHLVEPGPAP